ncbi:MAG: aldo/keto reductase [Paracoccaceae bacterium]
MKIRKLGKTGFDVSEIGMGCWQLGGDFGPIEDATSQAALGAAHDAGITFYDTADVYGDGRSEVQVGHFLKGKGAGSVVATKVGRTAALYPASYARDAIAEHLRASARRLGVDRLDLVQLHCVPPAVLEDGGIFAIMDQMVADGLTANWGASVETLAEARVCMAQPGCTTLQIIFNLYRQNAAWEIFDEAKAKNVGIIVRLPLASGVLTGKFAKGQTFPETDHRNYNADGAAFSVGETFSGIEARQGGRRARSDPAAGARGDEPRRLCAQVDPRPRRGELGDRRGFAGGTGGAQCRGVGGCRRSGMMCMPSSSGSTRRRSNSWCAARSEALAGAVCSVFVLPRDSAPGIGLWPDLQHPAGAGPVKRAGSGAMGRFSRSRVAESTPPRNRPESDGNVANPLKTRL